MDSKINLSLKYVTLLTIFYTFTVISVIYSQTVEPNNDFYCSDAFCPEWVRQNPCSTRSASCNTTGFREFLDPGRCNCCPYCFDYMKENDTCSPTSLEKPVEMCGPFLGCKENEEETAALCKPITTNAASNCLPERHQYLTNKQGIAQFLPDCDAHGFYSPRQCLPGSLCYCSDRNGNRIFGESAANEPQDCACARDVARLQEFGFEGKFPHCLPNGDYDELQCVIRSCFCRSDPSKVFFPQNINKMPCFNSQIHRHDDFDQLYYIKGCEQQLAELEVERLEAEINGTVIMIISDLPRCSPDGNYDRIQASQNKLFCSDPDGIQIENYEARKYSTEAGKMNCYCARARDLLKESATGKPKCCPNGNYRPYQCVGSTCFCVDREGKQIVSDSTPIEVPDDEIDKLPCVIAAGTENICSLA